MPKPGYKLTELGEIPASWEVQTLGENVSRIIGGGTPSRTSTEHFTGAIPWLTVKDLTRAYIEDSQEHITEGALNGSSSSLIPKDSLIVATRMAVGRAAINLVDAAINQDLKALILGKNLEARFILYWFQESQQIVERLGSGSTVKGIALDQLRSFKLALPPRIEQEKISDVLISVDAALEHTQAVLEQVRRVRREMARSLLTPTISSTNELPQAHRLAAEWEIVPLSSIVSKLIGGVSVNGVARQAVYGEFGVLKVSAVSGGRFFSKEHKAISASEVARARVSPKKDRVIISRSNTAELVGETGYVDSDYPHLFLPDKLWQIELKDPDRVSARWLVYALVHAKANHELMPLATGSSKSMKNISKDKLLRHKLALPPRPDQDRIVSILSAFDARLEAERAKKAQLETLKKGLMQALLTGRVRVKAP